MCACILNLWWVQYVVDGCSVQTVLSENAKYYSQNSRNLNCILSDSLKLHFSSFYIKFNFLHNQKRNGSQKYKGYSFWETFLCLKKYEETIQSLEDIFSLDFIIHFSLARIRVYLRYMSRKYNLEQIELWWLHHCGSLLFLPCFPRLASTVPVSSVLQRLWLLWWNWWWWAEDATTSPFFWWISIAKTVLYKVVICSWLPILLSNLVYLIILLFSDQQRVEP